MKQALLPLSLRQVALGCAFTSLTLLATTAKATLIAEDQYLTDSADYTVGDAIGQSPASTGFSDSNAWVSGSGGGTVSIQSTSLTYADPNYTISSAGGDIFFGTTGGLRAGRGFDGSLLAAGQTSTVYMSVLMQLSSSDGYSAFELDNGGGFDDSGNRVLQLGVGVSGGIGLGVNGQPDVTVGTYNSGVNLYVLKFTINPDASLDTVTAWEDPTLGGVGDPTGGVTVTGALQSTIDTVSAASFNGGGDVTLDNFLVGTTLADVTGSAVPEPTSWSLFGLGGLALIVIARRKLA